MHIPDETRRHEVALMMTRRLAIVGALAAAFGFMFGTTMLHAANCTGPRVQRVNVDFPVDLLREIDHEARRLGVTRQAFIKVRLADAFLNVGQ